MKDWLKKYKDGGPGDETTPGPVVVPYASTTTETTLPFMNIFNQPSSSAPKSAFDYNDYYNKANKYLSRPTFKGTTLSAKDIADAAQEFYNTSNYVYPLDLLLTQGQMESKLGKTLKSKNNFFNIGNTDSGATRNFNTPKDSVYTYMNTMYNDYLQKGKKSPDDLLKPKGFVNYQGNRYASASDYETQLANQRAVVQKYLNKKDGGDISIPDLSPNNWIMKYDNGGPKSKNNYGLPSSRELAQQRSNTESSRVDSITKLKAQGEQEKRDIDNWKKRNKSQLIQLSGLSDREILNRINIEDSVRKSNQTQNLRGITNKQFEKNKDRGTTTPNWFDLRKSEGRANEEARNKKEEWKKNIDEENRAKAALDKGAEFVFPNGTRKKYADMDKSEKAYVYSKGNIRPSLTTTDREDYYSPKNIIEEFNPFSTASGWVGNFAEAPELTEESGSILPWVGAVADPILTVAPYLIGQPELSAGQVLRKKIFNPIKPIQDAAKVITAFEEGQLGNYAEKKVKEKITKTIASDVNQGIKESPQIVNQQNKSQEPFMASVGFKYGGSSNWLNKYK